MGSVSGSVSDRFRTRFLDPIRMGSNLGSGGDLGHDQPRPAREGSGTTPRNPPGTPSREGVPGGFREPVPTPFPTWSLPFRQTRDTPATLSRVPHPDTLPGGCPEGIPEPGSGIPPNLGSGHPSGMHPGWVSGTGFREPRSGHPSGMGVRNQVPGTWFQVPPNLGSGYPSGWVPGTGFRVPGSKIGRAHV